MSVDLRTELNDCDVATGWTGDGPTPAVTTLTGQRYQGTGAIESQHSNANEHMATTNETVGATTFSLSAADFTFYLQLKDNLVNTALNGGIQFVLGDGTDKVGFDVGGNDAVGLPLTPFYNAYKLDSSNLPSGSNITYTGTEGNLTLSAITEVGVGTLHLAKAQGNVTNIFVDYISYIANGSYALRINGGTSGVPETMVDVQGDDETNGWGMVNNPLGAQYGFFAPTEWGEPAANADSYFTASNEQWYWIGDNGGGAAVGALNFPFRVVGNATDTISFVLDNVVIVNTGQRAEFDMSSADVNTLQLDAVTFTDLGAITFPANTATKHANNCIFNNCAQVYLDTLTCDGLIFNGTTNALGAIQWDGTVTEENQDNLTFNSDGTGHAIEISLNTASLTTFNIDGYSVNGYETASLGSTGNTVFNVDNALDGDVTINVTNGNGTFSYERAAGYTGTVTIVASVTVTVKCVDSVTGANLQGVAVNLGTTGFGSNDVISFALTDVNGEVSVSYTGSTPQAVNGFAAKGTTTPTYKRAGITGSITSTGALLVVPMTSDD